MVNMEELIDVHSDSGNVKNKKSDHNAEKNKKEVDFFLEHFLWPKPVCFYFLQIQDNPNIENEHGK